MLVWGMGPPRHSSTWELQMMGIGWVCVTWEEAWAHTGGGERRRGQAEGWLGFCDLLTCV